MINEISAMALRKNLGGVLNRVHLTHESILIRRAEQPIAVLIDVDTFYQKIANLNPSRSLRNFSDTINLDFGTYKFNREDANAR